jgi:hypothetical protein
MATHVRLENPDTGGVWDCPADAVDWHLRRGWVETDKPLASEEEEEPPAVKAPKDAPTREAKPSTSAKAKATDKPSKE